MHDATIVVRGERNHRAMRAARVGVRGENPEPVQALDRAIEKCCRCMWRVDAFRSTELWKPPGAACFSCICSIDTAHQGR